jgi:hypothetical protein
MQSKQIKIQDFEKKVRQFLYDFFSGALLPETGKGFFNGFPGRGDKTFVRVKIPAPDSYRDAGMTAVLKKARSRNSD